VLVLRLRLRLRLILTLPEMLLLILTTVILRLWRLLGLFPFIIATLVVPVITLLAPVSRVVA
jgi:hypothetical protein